jgi:hypothetical protein
MPDAGIATSRLTSFKRLGSTSLAQKSVSLATAAIDRAEAERNGEHECETSFSPSQQLLSF